jgi:UDP-glucose 4-epimerase
VRTQRVIVTGGAGFIGATLTDALLAEGARVVVIDDLSTGRAENLNVQADFQQLDITDGRRLESLVTTVKPSAIFHLAAQSSVTVSVSEPSRDCAVNVQGTLNVLEAAKRFSAPVVFASTGGALYGNAAPIPTKEDRIPAPLAPYGASKWAGEAYVLTWAQSTGIPNTVCRLGNVYGPRQSPHGEAGVIAIFSHRLWSGERPTVFGFGKPTRDYVHVDDVARAMMAANGRTGTFNIATGIETTVSTILAELSRVSGLPVDPILAPLREGELERSCLDPTRAHTELGWIAEVALPDGIAATYGALVEEFNRTAA